MKITFVCTGNSCRSPMAELYFASLCRQAGRNDIISASGGVFAWPGDTISPAAAAVMESLGIPSGDFRTRRFDSYSAAESDLIIAMTAGHKEAIIAISPEAAAKTRVLLDYSSGGDVPDPYGGSVAEYRKVFDIMKDALDNLAAGIFKTEK